MNLLEEFKIVANKLKKTQRIVFKKQDTKELANEFNQLALKFESLPEYAGLCYLGVSKCYENTGDVEALLKGARMFIKANEKKNNLGSINNDSNIEGAYRCYSQALSSEKNSVMKTCIIREFKEINKNLQTTSDFDSNPHRVYELELSSNNDIKSHDYISALEKLTEIIENFSERKCERLYADVLLRTEITRLLLLIILNLPANRQSPSHIKIMERFSWFNENFTAEKSLECKHLIISEEDDCLILLLEMLVNLCTRDKNYESIKELCDMISSYKISDEQKLLLENLLKLYET